MSGVTDKLSKMYIQLDIDNDFLRNEMKQIKFDNDYLDSLRTCKEEINWDKVVALQPNIPKELRISRYRKQISPVKVAVDELQSKTIE